MSKYKLHFNREKLSREEISKHMNFDKFLSGYTAPTHSWLGKTGKAFLGASVSAAVIFSAAYIFYQHGSPSASTAHRSFIDPPLQGLNISKDSLVIDSERDTTITMASGTTIDLPAHIFETAGGQEVKGKIQLCYREFRDQVDLILSGIPMNYDSAAVHEQLESDGMFEVLAYQNGKQIYLKENKELKINMLCHNTSNDFNVYYLDTVKQQWLYNPVNTQQNKNTIAALEEQKEKFIQKYELVDAQKLLTPGRAHPLHHNFIIDYDQEEFPELSVYEGVKFEIDEHDKKYDPQLSELVWEDVLVRRHQDAKHYVITFKKGQKSHSFTTSPVFEEKDFDAAMKAYEKMRAYHQNRLKTISDSVAQKEALYVSQAGQNSRLNTRFTNYITSGQVYRAIVVNRLGIWNHDARFRFFEKEPERFAAHFSGSDGEELVVKSVYLINREKNAIYTLLEKDLNEFSFSQDVDILVAVTSDNKIRYIKDQQLKQLNFKAKDVFFKVQELKSGFNDANYIKTMLSI